MKIKTGIDIIEVDRIEKAIKEMGDIFLNKIYTKEEIEYCKNSGKMEYKHFAVRFAAKEAIFKALSEELENYNDKIWTNICIKNSEKGRPKVELNNMDFIKIESMDLSLSHIKDYAVANFVAILKD